MIETILQKLFYKITFEKLKLHFMGNIYLYCLGYHKLKCFPFFIICEIFHLIYEIVNLSYFKKDGFYYILDKKFDRRENIDFIYKSGNQKIFQIFKNNCFKTINFKFVHSKPFEKNIFCSHLNFTNLAYSNSSFRNFYCKNLSIKNSHQLSWPNYPLNYQTKSLDLNNNLYLSFHGNYQYLRTLNLSSNNLHALHLACPNLKSLSVQNNKLTYLNLELCPLLKYLDVSQNLLENIKIVDLEYLDLSNNQFVVVPFRFSKINYLSLKNNPIIPTLNHPHWNIFFNNNYPEFFQNDIDINVKNIYLHPELVHNPYLQNSTRLCLQELYEIYEKNQIPNSNILIPSYQIGFFIFQDINFTLKNLVDTILFLADNDKNIIDILLEEIKDGQNYCLSGKISRIINSIMGFNLIKNKISISKNDEIIIQYDKLKKKLLKKYEDETPEFQNEFKEEFSQVLDELNLSPNTLNNWKSGL